MRILNLVYPENSDINYTVSKFPDGQKNVIISQEFPSDKLKIFKSKYPDEMDSIQIKSRLNDWLDLEFIVCTVASLRELGVEEIHLYTPYIMGARSDRKFEEGGNNYLKDVICPIINSLNFKSVTCIDPHSDVLEACLKNFRKVNNIELVKFAFNDIYNLVCGETAYLKQDKFVLVSPDAGASKKIYKLAEEIGYKGDIITCSKERDKDGKLTKTNVPLLDLSKDLIIVDDICDGGNTFINIAKIIKEKQSKYPKEDCGKIYLIVTHGIFSRGFKESELYDLFDKIYCTNSYKDLYMPGLKKNEDLFVKQLNLF